MKVVVRCDAGELTRVVQAVLKEASFDRDGLLVEEVVDATLVEPPKGPLGVRVQARTKIANAVLRRLEQLRLARPVAVVRVLCIPRFQSNEVGLDVNVEALDVSRWSLINLVVRWLLQRKATKALRRRSASLAPLITLPLARSGIGLDDVHVNASDVRLGQESRQLLVEVTGGVSARAPAPSSQQPGPAS